MICIYTTRMTSRLMYTAQFIVNGIWGDRLQLTSSSVEYNDFQGPRINYSDEALQGITIHPDSLLFEKGIRKREITLFQYEGVPVIFGNSGEQELPFDPFAAVFFMISRYEEYWDLPCDLHGRFQAENSVAFRQGFLSIPVVDQWAMMLKRLIIKRYPDYPVRNRLYRYLPTFDIDIAYAYKGRSLWRFTGAMVRSLLKGEVKENRHRWRSVLGKEADPFDPGEHIFKLMEETNLRPVVFFLLGRSGPYDRNLSVTGRQFRRLIIETAGKFDLGIHPSYRSNSDPGELREEIEKLRRLTHQEVLRSRQHYLKLHLPETYRQLIAQGIREDYTMGYASHAGFRAGTCTPFWFYDIPAEQVTPLKVFPFQVMDGTLNQYMHLSPEEAMATVTRLIDQVKNVNGTFISLWHNESLGEMREWKNWRNVFYYVYKTAIQGMDHTL